MKQKTGLFTLLAIAVTVLLFVISGKRAYERRQEKKATEAGLSAPAPAYTPSSLSLKKIIGTPIRRESTEMARLSPACAHLEESLFALTLTDLDYPPKMDRLPDSKGCSPENSKFAKLKTYYEKTCAFSFQSLSQANLSEQKWNEGMGECRMAVMMLRSSLASLARGDRPLSEIQDLRELADLLVSNFGAFFTGDMSVEVAADVRKIADRMAEVEPHLIPAVKAGAMGAMLENMMKLSTKSESPPDWAGLEARVADLNILIPNDPDLDTLRRISDTEGMNPDLVLKDTAARLAKNPNDWREHQVLAWANFRQGHREAAIAALAKARALNPNNPELKENWAVVHRANAVSEDFKVTMNIGAGFNEFLK